jgi:phosphoribosylaminoimidazole-succinocarboxamide synthase
VKLLHSGKVRDVYEDGHDLVLVATDRISVYDVVLPTPIPDKGKLLTQLSLWWFEEVSGLIKTHVRSAVDVPREFAGRAVRCQPLQMIQVECVARGYLTGSALEQYRATGAVCGVRLPGGLVEASKLPEPIFTPTTKAPLGAHDEPMTFEQLSDFVGLKTATDLRELTLAIYARGAKVAEGRDILIADTKLEFGRDSDGRLVLADEVLTSDSSRFWSSDDWTEGQVQHAFDKQYVRDWARSTGWDRRPPAPDVPDDVVAATRERYIDAYQRLTGLVWSDPSAGGPK